LPAVSVCSRLRCQKKSERDDEPSAFHVSSFPIRCCWGHLEAMAELARLRSAPGR
jgi:hypothetical protein